MLACRVENLFGENDYLCGRMAPYVITVGEINYLLFEDVKKLGFIYEPEDVEEIEYPKKSQESKSVTLVVSYKNIYGDNNYSSEYDKYAVEKDGIRYLTLDFIRKTTLSIMGCEIEEVEI